MKFKIVSKPSVKEASPITDKTKKALKEKPAKQVKETPKKRRSDKEIALMWLDDQLNGILSRSKEIDVENIAGYADGRKVAEQHTRKMQSIVAGRVEKYRAPIVTLLTSRGLA